MTFFGNIDRVYEEVVSACFAISLRLCVRTDLPPRRRVFAEYTER